MCQSLRASVVAWVVGWSLCYGMLLLDAPNTARLLSHYWLASLLSLAFAVQAIEAAMWYNIDNARSPWVADVLTRLVWCVVWAQAVAQCACAYVFGFQAFRAWSLHEAYTCVIIVVVGAAVLHACTSKGNWTTMIGPHNHIAWMKPVDGAYVPLWTDVWGWPYGISLLFPFVFMPSLSVLTFGAVWAAYWYAHTHSTRAEVPSQWCHVALTAAAVPYIAALWDRSQR